MGLTYKPFACISSQAKEKKIDEERLNKSKEKFLGKCRMCDATLSYSTGNIIVCNNPDCKGVKHTKENDDGTINTWYTPVFRLLDEEGENIAKGLFE